MELIYILIIPTGAMWPASIPIVIGVYIVPKIIIAFKQAIEEDKQNNEGA